jgi:hypothetical protein
MFSLKTFIAGAVVALCSSGAMANHYVSPSPLS